jgi:hypothetical protein
MEFQKRSFGQRWLLERQCDHSHNGKVGIPRPNMELVVVYQQPLKRDFKISKLVSEFCTFHTFENLLRYTVERCFLVLAQGTNKYPGYHRSSYRQCLVMESSQTLKQIIVEKYHSKC